MLTRTDAKACVDASIKAIKATQRKRLHIYELLPLLQSPSCTEAEAASTKQLFLVKLTSRSSIVTPAMTMQPSARAIAQIRKQADGIKPPVGLSCRSPRHPARAVSCQATNRTRSSACAAAFGDCACDVRLYAGAPTHSAPMAPKRACPRTFGVAVTSAEPGQWIERLLAAHIPVSIRR